MAVQRQPGQKAIGRPKGDSHAKWRAVNTSQLADSLRALELTVGHDKHPARRLKLATAMREMDLRSVQREAIMQLRAEGWSWRDIDAVTGHPHPYSWRIVNSDEG